MSRISPSIHGSDQRFLNNFQRNSDNTQTAVERLSTGKRINHPKDDPSGFVAAEEFRKELSDLKQKVKSIDGERSQNHIRQSGLADIQSALTDLRGQFAGVAGTLSADDRDSLENEINEAVAAFNRIAKQTGNDVLELSVSANLDSPSGIAAAAQQLDGLSANVTAHEVALAVHERTHLDTFESLYKDQITITTEALSHVEDADFAVETANLVQSQILTQGSMAALAYSSRENLNQLTALLDAVA